MSSTGYIYIPTSCASGETQCRIHVSFHGCGQTQSQIGAEYPQGIGESQHRRRFHHHPFLTLLASLAPPPAGLNEYAEANDIVVIYPFASINPIDNPKGCWDWWGYTGVDYGFKYSTQMAAVKRIIDAVSKKTRNLRGLKAG